MKQIVVYAAALALLLCACAIEVQADQPQSTAGKGTPEASAAEARRAVLFDSAVSGAVTDFVIDCRAENLFVRQEGPDFRIEVDAQGKDSYTIRDNRDVPYQERYFLYANWDLIFERSRTPEGPVEYSPAVIVTIPEHPDATVYMYLITEGGGIRVQGLGNADIIVDSADGDVYIADTDTRHITVAARGRIDLVNVTAQLDILINNRSYFGSEYAAGPGGKRTIALAPGRDRDATK